MGSSLNKGLLFTSNCYNYEMCCFERDVSAPERQLEKFNIDWLVYCYEAKCTMQWDEKMSEKMSVDSIQN